jgi:hypothetical protein
MRIAPGRCAALRGYWLGSLSAAPKTAILRMRLRNQFRISNWNWQQQNDAGGPGCNLGRQEAFAKRPPLPTCLLNRCAGIVQNRRQERPATAICRPAIRLLRDFLGLQAPVPARSRPAETNRAGRAKPLADVAGRQVRGVCPHARATCMHSSGCRIRQRLFPNRITTVFPGRLEHCPRRH